ncbi:D-alanyl-D-alanine carboxypeptidase/D-alanyl-D-alanine-endopeptidase [Nocardioides sp. GY 10113]|uniref:D-alanyl-D-alanine carboxypeptidase/D-alanyl-D-alanine endopeptidase n=1 Tax=Nocardioides sp. GY 10113 TaxID=2569761 RepID=UPI0010A784B9|nr:D-alanyl-D-alanine carboxypeptidase/D-alanyl-D-alanine-endopeptidase [Nocardioides sp. GY 10113]TIC89207.1 D-alanyl-D-alanine carboxypeptidase/D-alanyl-D-alanine-endopeptidase [Nocardioides sp. GY 10113]
MSRRRGEPRRRPLRTLLVLVVVVALVGGGVVAWRTGWAEDRWHEWTADDAAASTDPAAVAPPPEVEAPPVVRPPAVAEPADVDGPLRRGAIARAIDRPLADRDLGPHVLAAVGPMDGTAITYQLPHSGPDLAIPASTTKVVTSAVALWALGADHVFTTRTVRSAGGGVPLVTLVGGGDPFLASAPAASTVSTSATVVPERADVATLAQRTARRLVRTGAGEVKVAYDDSLFTGPAVNPRWEPDYVPDGVVAPISALWVDEGRSPSGYGRVADPAAHAAEVFAAELRKRGISVVGTTRRRVAPEDARPLAAMDSAPLAEIVQRVLEVSDNEGAEVLLRHVGLSQEGVGSTDAGRSGVERVLAANDVAMDGSVLYDGSGLSRQNRMSPALLLGVLRWAGRPDQDELWPALTGLPVAGFTGSLTDRMDRGDPDGLGRVRAKTGTLTGVTSLAGIAVGPDGELMVFALMADRVPEDKDLLARVAMDNAAAALGACRCGRAGGAAGGS